MWSSLYLLPYITYEFPTCVCVLCAKSIGTPLGKLDRVKCLRSVEICDSLNCSSDENCYLQQDVDYGSKTATVKTVCSKTDPCSTKSCPDGCVTVAYGDQPPTAKCISTSSSNPCDSYKCPDGLKCYVKTSYAFGLPTQKEPSCADLSACEEGCGFLKCCALQVQPDGTVKGVCTWSLKLI